MPLNKLVRLGPILLTTTLTTNILNPGTLTGGVGMPAGSNLYFLLRKMRLVNRSASAATVSFWVGATAGNVAGTEVYVSATNVPANSFIESFDILRLDVADFLVGGASAASTIVAVWQSEIGVA